MMNMIWETWELAVTLFECGIATRFVCEFLGLQVHEKRGQKRWLGMALCLAIAVTAFNQIMPYEGVLDFVYIMIVFVYALFLLPGTVLKKGFVSVFYLCCVVMDSSLGANLVSHITDTALEDIYADRGIPRFLATLLVQLLNLLVFQTLTRLFGKDGVRLRKAEWGLLGSIFSVSILAMVLIQLSLLHSDAAQTERLYLLGVDIAIIFMDFIVIRLIVNLNRYHQTALENEQLRMQMQYQTQYAETVRQQEESVHRLRHDFKATISALHDFIQENNTQDMKEYLNAYAASLTETASIVRTNQPFLNAILNTKLTYAKEHGIRCTCHSPENLPDLNGVDYCSLLGNLLDNAIEAELSSQISEPEMHVNLEIIGNRLSVYVRNRIADSVLKHNPKLLTTKEQSKNHGYGVAAIRNIAEKYEGIVDFYEDDGWFIAYAELYAE